MSQVSKNKVEKSNFFRFFSKIPVGISKEGRKIYSKWINNYEKGSKKPFSLKYLDISSGTVFQQKVWKELSKIPYGKTISYKELAKKVGSPRGFRAVGNANGKNPFPLIIPCHRVIANDGSLGGYSCGLGLKMILLGIERKNELYVKLGEAEMDKESGDKGRPFKEVFRDLRKKYNLY